MFELYVGYNIDSEWDETIEYELYSTYNSLSDAKAKALELYKKGVYTTKIIEKDSSSSKPCR